MSPPSQVPAPKRELTDLEKIEKQATFLMKVAQTVLVGVLVVATCALLLFFGWFAWHQARLSYMPEHWGQAGDFIGGMVNPAVGLGTVVLIFIGLRVQRAELSATTRQLEKANIQAQVLGFEQSLFSWLANYHSLLEGVTSPQVVDSTGSIELPAARGRSALEYWYRRYFTAARAINGARFETLSDYFISDANSTINKLRKAERKTIEHDRIGEAFLGARKGYMDLFDLRRLELDAVLRTLFRLFQWIDQSELSAKQRWHYAALVRAQLSWVELAYLLYNACSEEGKAFAYYVNRYAILDNLVGDHDPLIKTIREDPDLIKTSHAIVKLGYAWPLGSDAFSSQIAKAKLLAEIPASACSQAGADGSP